jgi:hypothetical protein
LWVRNGVHSASLRTVEGLFGKKSSDSSLESREYGRRDPSRRTRGTLFPQKLALTALTSGGRSVGVVHSRTQATEFSIIQRERMHGHMTQSIDL